MGKSHVEKIYDFARENGYRIKELNTQRRHSHKGEYNYVKLEMECGEKDFSEEIQELEKDLEAKREEPKIKNMKVR